MATSGAATHPVVANQHARAPAAAIEEVDHRRVRKVLRARGAAHLGAGVGGSDDDELAPGRSQRLKARRVDVVGKNLVELLDGGGIVYDVELLCELGRRRRSGALGFAVVFEHGPAADERAATRLDLARQLGFGDVGINPERIGDGKAVAGRGVLGEVTGAVVREGRRVGDDDGVVQRDGFVVQGEPVGGGGLRALGGRAPGAREDAGQGKDDCKHRATADQDAREEGEDEKRARTRSEDGLSRLLDARGGWAQVRPRRDLRHGDREARLDAPRHGSPGCRECPRARAYDRPWCPRARNMSKLLDMGKFACRCEPLSRLPCCEPESARCGVV